MDVSKIDREKDQVADIASDGDVVLVVGAENLRLRVYSSHLRTASKIFAVMFGPHWSEGQNLSTEAPKEVPLPEDDPVAMQTICNFLHHRSKLVSCNVTHKEVLQLAILADKYDLKDTLMFPSLQWLTPKLSGEMMESGYFLAAAYLFENNDAFIVYTRRLVLEDFATYLALMKDETIAQILPPQIYYLLEEHRTKLRADLTQILWEGKDDVCRACGWGQFRSDSCARLLSRYRPTRILTYTISEVIRSMELVCTVHIATRPQWCGETKRSHFVWEWNNPLLAKLEAIKKDAGLSIDSVHNVDTTCKNINLEP